MRSSSSSKVVTSFLIKENEERNGRESGRRLPSDPAVLPSLKDGLSAKGRQKKKFSIALSSIYNTKQSSIFIFKCKNKKSIYRCADRCVFLKEKPFCSAGAKLEGSSPIGNKGLLLNGGEGGNAWKVGCWGFYSLNITLGFLCAMPTLKWSLNRWKHVLAAAVSRAPWLWFKVHVYLYTRGFRNTSWLVNLSMLLTSGYWGFFLVGLACH